MVRRGWLLWALLIAGAAPGTVQARYALHWVRAEGAERCIDPKALATRVEALIGPVFVAPAQAEISLEGEIAPAGRGFRVRLTSTGPGDVQRGERILSTHSGDCRQLDGAVAFVLAVTVEPTFSHADLPEAVLEEFAQEVAPEQVLLAELSAQLPRSKEATSDVLQARAAPVSQAQPKPDVAPFEAPSDQRAPRYGASLALATLGRSLPDWPVGLRGTFSFAPSRHVPIVLSLNAFPAAAAHPIAEQRQTKLQSYELGLALCPGGGRGRFVAHGCLGAALGYLRARGQGFERVYRTALWDPALVLGASLGLALGRGFGLAADVMLRMRVTNRRFTFRDADESIQSAYRPARFGVLLALGPRYEF